jgi:adhesin/invasin
MPLLTRAALLAAALTLASCDSPSGSGGGAPARLDVVSGGGQRDTVGHELPQPLVVRVLDARGRPVPDAMVDFRVTAGGGAVSAGTANTDANGEARVRWALGTSTRESQHVNARVFDPRNEEALVFGVFTAVAVADVPTDISPTGPAQFTIAPGGSLPVGVRLLDRYGNRVADAAVSWRAADGAVTPAEGVTDSTGVATVSWTLAYAVGAQTLTASAGASLSTRFTASTPAPGGSRLVIVSGDRQRVEAGAALPQPLVVRMQDAQGQPLRGAVVQWAPTAGTITPAPAVTDAQGQVSVAWHPGTAQGPRSVVVNADGANSIVLTAEVTAGAPAELRKTSGDEQSAAAGSPLPLPVFLAILDAHGNRIAAQVVRWRVVSGGGSVSPESMLSTDGTASTRWTLGPTVGQQEIEAELGALRARFTATARQ